MFRKPAAGPTYTVKVNPGQIRDTAGNVTGAITLGTISGTVEDQGRAVIPNATVTLENTSTGEKRTVASNGTGFFNFAAVRVGTYKVTITASGFNEFTATDIIITDTVEVARPSM